MKFPSFKMVSFRVYAGILALSLVVAVAVFWKIANSDDSRARVVTLDNGSFQQTPPGARVIPTDDAEVSGIAVSGEVDERSENTFRPLAVSISSATHEWTAGDATDLKVIEKIAHNPDEIIRLVEENDRIKRRQLVYRRDPAWQIVGRARAAGEPIKTLILPGVDGQEFQVEVKKADIEPSGLNGTFAGHLRGCPQSTVSIAFRQGREAFTVLSPEDGTYLQGHPREPGELIVTSFDLDSYQTQPCGKPILTQPISTHSH